MMEVTVPLGQRGYSIIIAPGLLQKLTWRETHCSHELVIISDQNVADLYLNNLLKHCEKWHRVVSIVFPAGEQHKNIDTWSGILDTMLKERVSREATILALGGGVVGDMAGFVASCYQRGVDFIQIPTTLLAMVDSSVGGKTAINHPLGKNMIGSFYQPKLVVADLDVLATLPEREYAAGLAEVLKYGLIRDAELFRTLMREVDALQQRRLDILGSIVSECCRIKAEVVGLDEREQGVRAILNFGHTFGHALEAVTEYRRYLHGEAVAIGMMLALRLSMMMNQLDPGVLAQTENWLAKMGLPTVLPEDIDRDALWQAMQSDKKKTHRGLRFILLNSLGDAVVEETVDFKLVKEILA